MKLIPIEEFLSTIEEIHAFIIGIGHGFFWWQRHSCPEKYKNEDHYYEQGKIAGMMVFGVFMACLGWLVKSLLF